MIKKNLNMNLHKCEAKDCNKMIDINYRTCSIECACYTGNFSIKDGWLDKPEIPLNKNITIKL